MFIKRFAAAHLGTLVYFMQIDLTSPEILNLKVPQFRDDIEVYPGPLEVDGSPSYNVFDPVTAQYYKISWTEATIMRLCRPGMSLGELLQAIDQKTTLQVMPEQIIVFFEDAARSNLTISFRSSESLWLQKQARKINPLKWALYHYLYIRLPLLSPDKFLERTLGRAKLLCSPFMLKIYVVITLLGFFILLNRFDEYIHTFSYFFNWEGAVFYVVTIMIVKVIHEFSHAYTAKNFGIRVPTMGVALIVMWPVLYTDVTDGWRLSKRSQRLAISAAGVASELVLAGICTLGWALTAPGRLQSMFFIVSSTTWITSLVINLNPAMRWDGYYLLCDLWGIDNLQSRAFAITRWRIRKWLWGIDVPPPEEGLSTRREAGLIIYTLYTWVYRLILYTAVAIFVYKVFAKALGIFLFFLEIGVFIVAPFISEAKHLYMLRKYMTFNRRSITTCIVLGLILGWFILPLPHARSFPAVSVPVNEQVVYVPAEGVVKDIFVKQGDQVTVGQPLLLVASIDLESNIKQKEVEKEIIEQQIRILGGLEKAQQKIPEKVAELEATQNLLNSLLQKQQLNILSSRIDGTVYYWDSKLAVSQSVSENVIVGRIGDLNQIKVVFFVPESDVSQISLGKNVKFQLRGTNQTYSGTVDSISPSKVTTLLYPQLASVHGGELPVVDKPGEGSNKALVMVESYYIVEMSLNQGNNPVRIGQVGQVLYRGKWFSIAGELISHMVSLFWREGNF
jgi:putative peptide zinc metalloprotease protein